MKLFRQHFDYEQLQNTFQKYENTSNAGHLSTKQPFQINKKYLSTCISFLKTKINIFPHFSHSIEKTNDNQAYTYLRPTKRSRLSASLAVTVSQQIDPNSVHQAFPVFIHFVRLSMTFAIRSPAWIRTSKGFNPLQIRKYFNFK